MNDIAKGFAFAWIIYLSVWVWILAMQLNRLQVEVGILTHH